MRFLITKFPEQSFSNDYRIIQNKEYNGAHAVYHLLTGRAQLPVTYIDIPSFTTAADTLFLNGIGLNILFRTGTVFSYLENILRHINAVLVYKIASDGLPKDHLQVLSGDTDTDTLPTVTEDMLLESPSLTRRSWNETYNEIRTEYTEITGTFPVVAGSFFVSHDHTPDTLSTGTAYSGSNGDFRFDSNDTYHLVSNHSGSVVLGIYNGSSWDETTLHNTAGDPNSENVGASHPCIDLDSNEDIYVSFATFRNDGAYGHRSMLVVSNTTGSWVTTHVEEYYGLRASLYSWELLDMIVDSNDYCHMVYRQNIYGGADSLRYATNATGSWVSEEVDTGYTCRYGTMVMHSDGDVIFVAFDGDNDRLRKAKGSAGSWSLSTIDTDASATLGRVDMTIDDNDDLHILWSLGLEGLNYYKNDSGERLGSFLPYVWDPLTILIDSLNNLIAIFPIYTEGESGHVIGRMVKPIGGSWGDLEQTEDEYSLVSHAHVDSSDVVHVMGYPNGYELLIESIV